LFFLAKFLGFFTQYSHTNINFNIKFSIFHQIPDSNDLHEHIGIEGSMKKLSNAQKVIWWKKVLPIIKMFFRLRKHRTVHGKALFWKTKKMLFIWLSLLKFKFPKGVYASMP